ncbi:MAG TPA: metallophosphoesterase [Verrucomicrobiae bacterium]|nr:metallophosphoesterase [Verrucomicrobiae bacterium]
MKCGLIAAPLSVGGAIAEAACWEPEWLKIRRITLRKGGTKIVHFTDVHFRGDAGYLLRVVQAINSQNADYVCFTGDLVEEAEFFAPALEILKSINGPLYGIPGNHDFWANADFDLARQAFAAQGGAWLMDESAMVTAGGIKIHGVTGARQPRWELLEGGANILLSHYPNWSQKITDARFDLILSGHSHGGQVRLPGIGALLTPSGVGKFDMGMFQTAAGPMYVNPGIGYFYANVRFCCRPEVTVFEV